MAQKDKVLRKLLEALCMVAFAIFGCIALIIITVGTSSDPLALGRGFLIVPNLVIAAAVVGCVFMAKVVCWSKRDDELSAHGDSERASKLYSRASYVVPVCLLGFQVLVYALAGIGTGWDAGAVASTATLSNEELASSHGAWEYFSQYPNNLFLLWLLRSANSLRLALFPFLGAQSFFALISCVACSTACFLFMRVARNVLESVRDAGIATVLYVLLVGINPWFMIPYTDTLALFCCSIMLWCAFCGKSRWVRWGLLSLVAGMSFAIKPTTIFLLVGVLVARVLSHKGALRVATVAACVAMIVGGLLAGTTCTKLATSSLPLELDEQRQFTFWHFLAMGLNEATDGKFSAEDVRDSQSFATIEERDHANKEKAKQRFTDMGPARLARLLYRKVVFNYGSGIFSWSSEGDFIISHRPLTTPVARFLADYLYEGWPLYGVFVTIQQVWWIITLIGIPLGLLGVRRKASSLPKIAAILAAVLMLTVFVLVFEARARYLYLFGGLYVLLAVWGYRQLLGCPSQNDTLNQQTPGRKVTHDKASA